MNPQAPSILTRTKPPPTPPTLLVPQAEARVSAAATNGGRENPAEKSGKDGEGGNVAPATLFGERDRSDESRVSAPPVARSVGGPPPQDRPDPSARGRPAEDDGLQPSDEYAGVAAANAQPVPVVRILRRDHRRHPQRPQRGSSSDSGDGGAGSDCPGSNMRRTLTIEERELAYGLARARIFGEDDKSSDTSRSSSSSPKPSVATGAPGLGANGENGDSPASSVSAKSRSSHGRTDTTAPPDAGQPCQPTSADSERHQAKKAPSGGTVPSTSRSGARPSRHTPKPRPQFRPPSSAMTAAVAAQMFGYPSYPSSHLAFTPAAPSYNMYPQYQPYGMQPPPALSAAPAAPPTYQFNPAAPPFHPSSATSAFDPYRQGYQPGQRPGPRPKYNPDESSLQLSAPAHHSHRQQFIGCMLTPVGQPSTSYAPRGTPAAVCEGIMSAAGYISPVETASTVGYGYAPGNPSMSAAQPAPTGPLDYFPQQNPLHGLYQPPGGRPPTGTLDYPYQQQHLDALAYANESQNHPLLTLPSSRSQDPSIVYPR